MPPRAKFTREQIVEKAVELVRESGMERLTARELGDALGSSARPIFTVFSSMEEVKDEVLKSARALYKRYVEEGLKETPAFKGVGSAYIRFAVREPKLFQLLFMTERGEKGNLSRTLEQIDESYEQILASVEKPYGLKREDAERLYRHLWVYTHGIATMCATNVCSFRAEEISTMMSEVFQSLLTAVKRGDFV